MKVILTEKVPSLGNVGEIVKVSAGYGRNFLLPRKLAVLADEANEKQLMNQKRRLSKKIDAQKNAALELKKKVEGVHLDFTKRVGSNGKLFGTVTSGDLAQELQNKGIEVDRRSIIITNPIKSLGSFDIKVRLFTEVEAHFKVKVAMDPKQAEELKALRESGGKGKKKEKKAKKDDAAALASENPEAEKEEVEIEESMEKEIKDFEKNS